MYKTNLKIYRFEEIILPRPTWIVVIKKNAIRKMGWIIFENFYMNCKTGRWWTVEDRDTSFQFCILWCIARAQPCWSHNSRVEALWNYTCFAWPCSAQRAIRGRSEFTTAIANVFVSLHTNLHGRSGFSDLFHPLQQSEFRSSHHVQIELTSTSTAH